MVCTQGSALHAWLNIITISTSNLLDSINLLPPTLSTQYFSTIRSPNPVSTTHARVNNDPFRSNVGSTLVRQSIAVLDSQSIFKLEGFQNGRVTETLL